MRAPDLRPFLEEDVGTGDVTSETFLPDRDGKAVITCEEDSVVAGLDEAVTIFSIMGVSCETFVKDGDRVAAGTKVLEASGPLRSLMTCERTALNFLMRMSGIAEATWSISKRVHEKDPDLRIAGSRKTTPGFRYFEKKAIALGGGWPHRMGLYDMAMVKDNHIAAAGGIDAIAEKMKDVPKGIPVEIEVLDIEEGIKAAKAGASIVMGDHMSPADVRTMREKLREINPRIFVEASGNITAETAADFAGCADIVSLGALTHSARSTHFSMDVE
ncbi:nicotinate-nucleotide pyrophosphorylase [Thermoplasmatales archaeon BRNA1]|nr:nicotinate-nucleotide pyrophosphorylase [Thermoplasmatales archaeon BRNA1]